MAEDVARAIGAGNPEPVIIAGKECRVRPLTIRDLTEIERDCLQRYKREYLKTFSENADLLPPGEGTNLIREKIEEVAKWDVSHLPSKFVYDPDRVSLTDNLRLWVNEHFPIEGIPTDKQIKRLASTALDGGMLDDTKYKDLTGEEPRKSKVGYVNWWISGSFDGMVAVVWHCFRAYGLTREQIADEVGKNPQLLIHLTREIEHLSAPASGNG